MPNNNIFLLVLDYFLSFKIIKMDFRAKAGQETSVKKQTDSFLDLRDEELHHN